MKSIELPIFHLNDRIETLQDVGISYSYQDCDVKPTTFYKIDALGIDTNHGIDYGLIFSGGSTFTSPMAYEDLKARIKIWMDKA